MKITIDDAVRQEELNTYLFKRRANNMLLNDYQVNVLKRFDIDYLKYSDYRSLLFEIETILSDDYDDELDLVCSQIAEYVYYNETKK